MAIGSVSASLNMWSSNPMNNGGENYPLMIGLHLSIALIVTTIVGLFLRSQLIFFIKNNKWLPLIIRQRYSNYETWSYSPFLIPIVGSVGISVDITWYLSIFIIFLLWQLMLIFFPIEEQCKNTKPFILLFLFSFSGVAALIYQVSWQRSLFTLFGVNIESITIVVSNFMLGLGIGALLGGYLAEKLPNRLPFLFLICELMIGLFGLISIYLINWVGNTTVESSLWGISLSIYLLLSIPTLFMGATLPILVTFLHKTLNHIGQSMGLLYFANTIGSAIACFFTTDVLFVLTGLTNSVMVAAILNLIIGLSVYRFMVSPFKEKVS
jgi:hypothetical protein